MKAFIDELNAEAEKCSCGKHESIQLYCVIESGAVRKAAGYLAERGLSRVQLVADAHTMKAAGEAIASMLGEQGIKHQVTILAADANGDVKADGNSVLQVLADMPKDTEAFLAVGSGTIHDIVRFVSFKTKKRFLSVPTAASVDGYTSTGAPMIINGMKVTLPAAAPEAIFADLDVLSAAPRALTAAGFGDMLGKFTSLADWQFSHKMAGEPFCPLAYDVTREALQSCIEAVDEIAEGTPAGIRTLFEALVKSGLSMLLVGHSRPASGGEHHVSHIWEMEHIRQNKPQLLHGAKVGIASILIADLYRKLAEKEGGSSILLFGALPEPEQLGRWLERVGGPTRPQDLGLSEEMVSDALNRAHTIRERYTGLKYWNDNRLQLL